MSPDALQLPLLEKIFCVRDGYIKQFLIQHARQQELGCIQKSRQVLQLRGFHFEIK